MQKYKFTIIGTLLLLVVTFAGPLINYLQAASPQFTPSNNDSLTGLTEKPKEEINKEEWKAQLKNQILSELREEIRGLVKQEVETYLANYQSDSEGKQLSTNIQSEGSSAETVQQAVRRVVRDIFAQDEKTRELTDIELDTYVASAIERETAIPGGLKKHHDYVIAQATFKPM